MRITKLSPVVQTYLKSTAMGQEKPLAVEASVGMAARGSIWMCKESKTYLEPGSGVQTLGQKMQESIVANKKQPESSTDYHAVPKHVDYLKCPDVGYQADDESKPYRVCACICRVRAGASCVGMYPTELQIALTEVRS